MSPTTKTALAAAGAALAVPAGALAQSDPPPTPEQTVLKASLVGRTPGAAPMHAAQRRSAQRRLAPRAVTLEARIAELHGEGFTRAAERRRLRGDAPEELRRKIRDRRRELRRAEAAAPAAPPHLEAIAACESGGDPATNTGNGFYGKYQFTLETWASVGGTGNPAAASEAEQDRRAATLYSRSGATPWPVCGQ